MDEPLLKAIGFLIVALFARLCLYHSLKPRRHQRRFWERDDKWEDYK